jgi:ArsR family transcriptional regulator
MTYAPAANDVGPFVIGARRRYTRPAMRQPESVDIDTLATVHKALGDSVRLRILQLLPRSLERGHRLYNVNELSDELGIPQPTVSHHLKILKYAGVIRSVKKQNSVFYYLDVKRLRQTWRDLHKGVLSR